MEKDDDYAWKIILWLILFLVFGIIIIACSKKTGEYIMTVSGPVSNSALGKTLTHEHVLVTFIGAGDIMNSHWHRDSVAAKLLPLLEKLKAYGVNSFIECTPEYLGRDPLLLKELSMKSGMIFITNTGLYGAYNRYLPEYAYHASAETLAEQWIAEFREGIKGTGIRPGFIKIAVNQDDTLSATDAKIIKAAALAHLETGLTIASHTGPEKPAFAQLEILGSYGVHPSAFIWVHAQRGSPEANIEAAKNGAWVSLDAVKFRPEAEPGSQGSVDWYADRIVKLKNAEVLDRLLLSHDSGWYDPEKPGGGQINGYTDIFEYLIPALTERGFTDEDINQILIRNPAASFKIHIRTTGNQ